MISNRGLNVKVWKSLDEVFGMGGSAKVPVFGDPVGVKPCEFTPEILLTLLYHTVLGGKKGGLWIYGPTGCGKTFTTVQFYARLGIRCFRLNFKDSSFEDLTGTTTLINGDTNFVQSGLTDCCEFGGIVLMDELPNVDPETLEPMFPLLEGEGMILVRDNGRYVKRHKWFRIIATGNTNGVAANMKDYVGSKRQSAALRDRFSWQYMPPKTEDEEVIQIMKSLTLPEEAELLVKGCVSTAHAVRRSSRLEGVVDGEYDFTMSQRVVERWIEAALALQTDNGVIKALRLAFTGGLATDADRVVVESLAELHIKGTQTAESGSEASA